MSFYLLAGIVGIFAGVVLIVVYIIATKMGEEHSLAGKIIIWIGMLLSMAGAAFMTVEYCYFPAPPKSIYSYFIDCYGDSYKEKLNSNEFIYINHTQLATTKNEEYNVTYFKSCFIYTVDEDMLESYVLNEYTYSKDHSYENINSIILSTVNYSSYNQEFIDYINTCVSVKFLLDHEESTIITISTYEFNGYYITSICYRIDFDNNIYKTDYISSVNDIGELIIKQIN